MPTTPPQRTAIYIDGYNLYYGRLRGTAFKWLDVVSLFQQLLARRDQNESLEQVKFFTAHALASFATNGDAAVEAQSAYHRALKRRHGDRMEFVYGKHSFDKKGSPLPVFVEGQPYDRTQRVKVWKLEEKKTDVNLAIGIYRDACKGLYDRIILVSNDSDAVFVCAGDEYETWVAKRPVQAPLNAVKTVWPKTLHAAWSDRKTERLSPATAHHSSVAESK